MTPDFSETNTQKEWREKLKSLREREEKKEQLRILFWAKWPFKSEEKIKTFSDKKLRRFGAGRPDLQDLLKSALWREGKQVRNSDLHKEGGAKEKE